MVLNLPGFPTLFLHSKEYSQGNGKVRKGAGEVVLAADGTGDFDTIEEALKSVEDGGRIIVKEGNYTLKTYTTIPNNIVIQGQGFNSVIKTGTADGDYWIKLTSKSNVLIRDLKIVSYAVDPTALIDLTSSSEITFEKVKFHMAEGSVPTGIFKATTTAINFRLLNCSYSETGTSGLGEGVLLTAVTKAQIIGNRFDLVSLNMTGDSIFTNCVVKNNYFAYFNIEAGSNNNVVTGNQSDNAITNAGTGNQVANNAIF